jgi:D-arabinose 1-dehydrogenase-like Zn-dependent alcohol dehydrogenase
MASTVRAAVLTKARTLEMRELARPAIGLDDALLRIEACGIPFAKMHTLSFHSSKPRMRSTRWPATYPA